MTRKFLHRAALMGAAAVLLGAFGAHKLKTMLDPETFSAFQTGITYQFYHTFALIAVGILYRRYKNNWLSTSGYLFVAGTILFSGSLYLLTAAVIFKGMTLGVFGFITPIGGLLLIGGWLCLLMGVPVARQIDYKSKSEDAD